MGRKLNTFVHVADEHGAMHVFGPDRDPEPWAEKAITNPDVWEGAEQASTPAEPVADPDGPPPKGGAGSGAPAWREYAARNNVEVASDASREDVVAALTEAGIPTE
ncbi:hypothetical protein AB0B48_08980 [Micromonospora sp. NPDC049089]|uniref:hypothetical protein n=1 Tax=Micromonospora sp. NPDC049089 TaxID=3155496 RepID=UPI0033E1A7B2